MVIHLTTPSVGRSGDATQIVWSVKHPSLPSMLRAVVLNSSASFTDASISDWALCAMLLPAMRLGEDIDLSGRPHDELLFFCQGDLQDALQHAIPGLSRIGIHCRGTTKPEPAGARVAATGFSAGIDSFFTLKSYGAEETPPELRVKLLTTYNVGALGAAGKARPLFERYSQRLAQFANAHNCDWVTVDTNLDALCRAVQLGFQQTHSLRNCAATMLVAGNVSVYLYSSSYAYPHVNRGVGDLAFHDPVILPLLSRPGLRFISAGAGRSRLEKTIDVANYPPSFSKLDVCIGSPDERALSKRPNCSRCWKCSRALLTFERLGVLEQYKEVFEIESYKRMRDKALASVRRKAHDGSPNDVDLLQFLGEPLSRRSGSVFRRICRR